MAETTFKAVPLEQLNAATREVIAANAKAQGVTPEQYLESRGGVNKSGYYGDAYQAAEQGGRPYLTDEEYAAVIADINAQGLKGTARGGAVNLATAKKQYDLAISQGKTSEEATSISGYDPATNSVIVTPSKYAGLSGDGSTGFTGSGSAAALAAQQAADAKKQAGQSAYNLLFEQFQQYGLGALVTPLQSLIVEGLSPSEFTLRLRDTDAYKKRFAANQQRIAKGLSALSEAEYIGLEDQYQSIMRQYGLPQSYYSRGDMGRQEGFEKFIAGDVSPVELEDRIQTAQNRVTNAPKQVRDALTQFYGAELGNGDILAYVLDPEKALSQIKRKVTAAEIGGGAAIAGLGLGKERAEELGMFGVTGEQARTGYQTIAEFLPTATKLGDIYAKQGLGPYNQAVAESEVFGVTGATDAAAKRRKLAQLESAQFSGQVGAAGGALSRERAGQF
jgi:hypothetical protein